MNRSKLYRSRLKTLDRQKLYTLQEGLEVLKAMPLVKFNETVEIAFKLGIDPKQSDQIVRGAMVLPNGTGKSIRVVVVAEGDAAQAATDSGADIVGFEDVLEKIKGGWLDFDILIATPEAMKKVRTLGRVLGPRGLMPNPKTGTVTDDTAKAVQDAKAGRVEYRADKTGCIHVPVGKVSFELIKLEENVKAIANAVERARPAVAKGVYMLSVTICSTMSPGIKLDPKAFTKV